MNKPYTEEGGIAKTLREYRRPIIAVAVLLGLLYLLAQQEKPETVTVRVLGDEGVPYEITGGNKHSSSTFRGAVGDGQEFYIDVSKKPSDDDYVKATAKKLPGADDLEPTEGDLVNVDLRLVSEDGTVLDEERGDGMLSYSLNNTSVRVDGDDIAELTR